MVVDRYNVFIFSLICSTLIFSSCLNKEYRLFVTDKNYVNDSIQLLLKETNPVFSIRPNDIVELNVYSSKGERIVDPELEYLSMGAGRSNVNMAVQAKERYIVQKDGTVFLPMVGRVMISGYTINQTDSVLSVQYNQYYKDAYVKTKIINKRVIVIGPMGGKVIPIENENTNLIEVIALYGGLNTEIRSDRIRVIRGDLSNPDVQIINLSTIEGMMQAQCKILPGDIVYVEPVKRVFRETMNDVLPAISLLVSLLTLLVFVNIR